MKLAIPFLIIDSFSKKTALAGGSRLLKKGGGFSVPVGGGSAGSGTSQPLCPIDGNWLEKHYMNDTSYLFGGVAPNGLFCGAVNGATCAVEINSRDDSLTNEFKCTQCDLTYPNGEFCFDYPCFIYKCLQNETAAVTSRNRNSLADNVTVCTEYTRSEFFTYTGETEEGSCSPNSAQRIFTKHFTAGVSNVRKVSLVLKNWYEDNNKYKEEPDTFESCEVLVDEVECNSCELCSSTDEGWFAADCSNIATGAIISCEDQNSFGVLDVSPFALILQEGVEFPAEVIEHKLDLTGSANVMKTVRNCMSVPLVASMYLAMGI